MGFERCVHIQHEPPATVPEVMRFHRNANGATLCATRS